VAADPRLRFRELWHRLGAAGRSDAPFDDLAAAYAEPGRAYHTLDHVLDCLSRLDEARDVPPERDVPERDLIEAAIWFHDVVYDPRRSDNEKRSGEWANRVLSAAGISEQSIARVQGLVHMTDHSTETTDPAGRLLCDIDLSILGAPPAEFDAYQDRIREEYAWVPESAYRAGRAAVLSGFLARPRLYLTDRYYDRYEAAARGNLRRALDGLKARGGS